MPAARKQSTFNYVSVNPRRARNAQTPLPPAVKGIIFPTKRAAHAAAFGDIEAVVRDAVRSRNRLAVAALEMGRTIIRLHDSGLSQRKIAVIVGLSQPEVSRRIKRRSLVTAEPGPREIIMRRNAGEMSDKDMLGALTNMTLTSVVPSEEARFDGAATSSGTAKQIASAFQDGLLTKAEYERVRKNALVSRAASSSGSAGSVNPVGPVARSSE